MNVNETYLPLAYDAVRERKAEQFFRQQYHILTSDHNEKYYETWINKWIDLYSMYRSRRFDDYDSIANGMVDCLEVLLHNGR